MKIKKVIPIILSAVLLSGCGLQSSGHNEDEDLTQEELERQALREWFSLSIKDEGEFTDIKDYQYYARTLGLDKDTFLSQDMWEIFYNENININRDVDGKAVYLIRLDPCRCGK